MGGDKIAPALNIFRGGGQEYTPAVRLGDEWGLFVYMFKLNKLTFNYFFLRSEFFNLLRVMIHESLKQAFLRKGQVPPPLIRLGGGQGAIVYLFSFYFLILFHLSEFPS